MLRYLMTRQAPVRVTDVAAELRLSVPAASQYLRTLNSRGLLKATRRSRHVFYELQSDPTLPSTEALLQALRCALGARDKSAESVFKDLTGFTHPRRVALLRAVAQGAYRVEDMRNRIAASQRATLRHARKLVHRGYLVKHKDGYRVAKPRSRFAQTLMKIAMASH